MKKEITIRMSFEDYKVITGHLAKAGKDESFIYCLFSKAIALNSTIYICRQLILPDVSELENQSGVSIEPSQAYQAAAYSLAYDQKMDIVDIHTHPFSRNARFSSIDDHYGTKNAQYIAANFPPDITMGMIVFGKGFDNFEAQIWNRGNDGFEPVHRIEILGVPTTILTSQNEPCISPKADPYARHRIIPGWKQGVLEKLKVFVCGLGGNGALVFESLLALGIGKDGGWIKACDPDVLEASNLPRIPYAYPKQVGWSKALVAKAYVRRKAADLNVTCFQDSVESELIQSHLKEANIIIGAIDNDGARLVLNSLAARYMIPYIDLGTEIIPGKDNYEAIGQVQIFVPGKTGCMMCSGAINPSQAALDSMSSEGRAGYERAGYVRGTQETPTPSVLHLNGVMSHLSISQMLCMIFNDGFEGKEFLLYNRQNANLLTASSIKNDECPVCGINGYLATGDEDKSVLDEISDLKDSSAFKSAR